MITVKEEKTEPSSLKTLYERPNAKASNLPLSDHYDENSRLRSMFNAKVFTKQTSVHSLFGPNAWDIRPRIIKFRKDQEPDRDRSKGSEESEDNLPVYLITRKIGRKEKRRLRKEKEQAEEKKKEMRKKAIAEADILNYSSSSLEFQEEDEGRGKLKARQSRYSINTSMLSRSSFFPMMQKKGLGGLGIFAKGLDKHGKRAIGIMKSKKGRSQMDESGQHDMSSADADMERKSVQRQEFERLSLFNVQCLDWEEMDFLESMRIAGLKLSREKTKQNTDVLLKRGEEGGREEKHFEDLDSSKDEEKVVRHKREDTKNTVKSSDSILADFLRAVKVVETEKDKGKEKAGQLSMKLSQIMTKKDVKKEDREAAGADDEFERFKETRKETIERMSKILPKYAAAEETRRPEEEVVQEEEKEMFEVNEMDQKGTRSEFEEVNPDESIRRIVPHISSVYVPKKKS